MWGSTPLQGFESSLKIGLNETTVHFVGECAGDLERLLDKDLVLEMRGSDLQRRRAKTLD